MVASTRKRSSISALVDKGFLEPAKRGRPPIYATDEERKAALRAQQKVCMARHNERVQEAKRRMLLSQGADVEEVY